jgi:hypothetical protein
MNLYDVWHVNVPSEKLRSISGFQARKKFAEKHHKQVSECMARRIYANPPSDRPAQTFSDGTSIRDEP